MKKRIITAIIMVVISAPLILLGKWYTTAFISAICFAGVYEIIKAVAKGKNWSPVVYVGIFISTVLMLYWPFIISYISKTTPFMSFPEPFKLGINFLAILAVLMILMMLEVVSHNYSIIDVFYCFSTILILSIGCQSFIYIREEIGLRAIAYILAVTCGCDSGAHIIGSRYGEHKLAPIISPSKTWEGAIGGCFISSVLGTIIFITIPFMDQYFGQYTLLAGAIISILLSIGAVFGDLIFSSIKRQSNIKDFSNALPGHGGVLDRIDSLLFNVCLFTIFYTLITTFVGV